MIDFPVSRILYTQERVLHFMREEITTPRETISLTQHILYNTRIRFYRYCFVQLHVR